MNATAAEAQASVPAGAHDSESDVEDEDHGFTYPDADNVEDDRTYKNSGAESDEEFTYPADEADHNSSTTTQEPSTSSVPPSLPESDTRQEPQPQPVIHVPPAQLEALYAAGLNGKLPILKKITLILLHEVSHTDMVISSFIRSIFYTHRDSIIFPALYNTQHRLLRETDTYQKVETRA